MSDDDDVNVSLLFTLLVEGWLGEHRDGDEEHWMEVKGGLAKDEERNV